MAFHTQSQLQQQQAQHQEYLRQLALSQQRFAERQMFEAIYHPQQIVTSASTSGGGGNPNPNVDGGNPRAIKISAKTVTMGYFDEVDTQNLVFFNADWDSVSFSDNVDSGIPIIDINNWYFTEMLDNKGSAAIIFMDNGDRYFILLDAGCNIVEKIFLPASIAHASTDSGGQLIQISYKNSDGNIVVKWWDGDVVFTHINTTVITSADYFYFGFQSEGYVFGDLTGTAYIYDETFSTYRVFHTRPDGQFIEVTRELTEDGKDYLHTIGNFNIYSYNFNSPQVVGKAAFNSSSYEVTLSAPISGLRRGMIIGTQDAYPPGSEPFDNNTFVSNISGNGLTITLSKYPNTTQNNEGVIFNGSFANTVNIVLADGSTSATIDVSGHDASINNLNLIGSDKAVLRFYKAYENSVMYAIYNHTTAVLNTSSFIRDLDVNNWYNSEHKRNFYSVYSPNGSEKFLGAHFTSNVTDGDFTVCEDLTFIWSNSDGEVFTHSIDTSVDSVRFCQSYYEFGETLYLFINYPESSELEIIAFLDDGSILNFDTGTLYANTTSPFFKAVLNKTLVSWVDSSRVAVGDTTTYGLLEVKSGQIQITGQIWLRPSTLYTRGETVLISYPEDVTIYLNHTTNTFQEIVGATAATNFLPFSENSYQNSINYETLANGIISFPGDFYGIWNPNNSLVITEDGIPAIAWKGDLNNAVKLTIDDGPEGYVWVEVWNYNGFTTVGFLTQANDYGSFWVVNGRIFLTQQVGDSSHIYLITPNTYVMKVIPTINFSRSSNDWINYND